MMRKEGLIKSKKIPNGIKFREEGKICTDCKQLIPKSSIKCIVCVIPEESMHGLMLK